MSRSEGLFCATVLKLLPGAEELVHGGWNHTTLKLELRHAKCREPCEDTSSKEERLRELQTPLFAKLDDQSKVVTDRFWRNSFDHTGIQLLKSYRSLDFNGGLHARQQVSLQSWRDRSIVPAQAIWRVMRGSVLTHKQNDFGYLRLPIVGVSEWQQLRACVVDTERQRVRLDQEPGNHRQAQTLLLAAVLEVCLAENINEDAGGLLCLRQGKAW
mmetsp:Transcript_117150/g.373121  ORF Transcript_117150/g.373121 Transcript_117150/m.373121 type:complete len:214 (+) Transcript_117150:5780-6421(+)